MRTRFKREDSPASRRTRGRAVRRVMSGQWAGAVLGAVAIFISLGGHTYAMKTLSGAKLEPNSVPGSKLKKNTVTSARIKDGTLRATDFAPGVLPPAGPITSAQIADGSISAEDLADNSVVARVLADDAVDAAAIADDAVGSAAVAADALTAEDLAADSVGGTEVAIDAIGSAEVRDNTLGAQDSAFRSGVIAANYPSIGPGACNGLRLELNLPGIGLTNDPTVVTPGDGFAGEVVTSVESAATGDTILKACNPTGIAIDPDGASGTNYYWALFRDAHA